MKSKYHSFLLRLWTTDHTVDEQIWRFSLQHSELGDIRYFASLAEMVTFLEMLTTKIADQSDNEAD